jgi:hypothetical protein
MKNYIATMALIAALVGCGEDVDAQVRDAASRDSGDAVEILEVSPEADSILKAGERVTFEFHVEYELVTAKAGSITLVVQDASNATLSNETYVVHKGNGEKTLKAEIVVPSTRAVQVFTPLTPQGQQATTIVESRLYKVGS